MPPHASVSGVVHSRVCGGPDTYCGHPYQDGMFDFGGGEIAVLHKHAPCDYASLESIGHAESHSKAKIVMQRSLDGGETWEPGRKVLWDESAPLEERMAFLRSTGPRAEIDLSHRDSAIFFARTRLHDELSESKMQTFAIRSADRGHTWEEHPIVMPPLHTTDPSAPMARRPLYKDGVPLIELDDGYLVTSLLPGGRERADAVRHRRRRPHLGLPVDGARRHLRIRTGRVSGGAEGLGRPAAAVHHEQPGEPQLPAAGRVGSTGIGGAKYRPIVRVGASPWLSRPVVPQSPYQLPGNVMYRSPWPMMLRDGRIVVIFARRKAPNGIGLIVSEDDGRTWSDEVILRDDAPSSRTWPRSYPVCHGAGGRAHLHRLLFQPRAGLAVVESSAAWLHQHGQYMARHQGDDSRRPSKKWGASTHTGHVHR